MRPTTSYIVWTSQRTGSTLLCKTLELTGIAGKPNELLNVGEPFDLFKMYEVDTPEALQRKLWELGTTPNGVFGLKLGVHEPHHTRMLDHFRPLPECPPDPRSRAAIWECAFPNLKHISLLRRNKVRLAVSWWKAIKSEEWHRKTGEPPQPGDMRDAYHFPALHNLFLQASFREAAVQEFFTEGGIVPLTIVHEDFIADYYGTVKRVIDFLGISSAEPWQIAPPFYEKLADEVSEEWVQRFSDECQKKFIGG